MSVSAGYDTDRSRLSTATSYILYLPYPNLILVFCMLNEHCSSVNAYKNVAVYISLTLSFRLYVVRGVEYF